MADVLGLFGQIGSTVINNEYANQRTREDRQQNYMYGEMAAENADKRTRALYNDYYSPEALMRQYEAAGLSPSLMFGGTPGQGGTSGAQGTGAAGPQTPFMPISMVEAAQAANLFAQTKKTKAETENIEEQTKNVEQDTALKELEVNLRKMTNKQFETEWQLINSTWESKETGKETSLFEMADNYYSYDSFLEAVRNEDTDPILKTASTTEAGQKVLRTIYESANRFHRDIAVLSDEEISAHFHNKITRLLDNKGFAEKNAEAAIAQLKQEISTNELTETQKQAWNNLINRLGKKGSTTRDIIVVLGMILGNFASHTGIKIQM